MPVPDADERARLRERCEVLEACLRNIREVVDAQAEDDGLWFEAQTAPEGYLQQELRRLHAAVEGDIG